MHVVELINGLGRGGGERLLVDLVRGLVQKGHTVAVYCLTRSGPLENELRAGRVRVECLTNEGRPHPLVIFRFLRDLRRCDVLHTHFFYSDLLGAVCAPVMGHGHRVVTRHDLGDWMSTWHRLVEPRVYSHCSDVICVSNAVKDALVERSTSADLLRVVPPAVTTGCRGRRRRAKQPFVLSIGRLEPVKGHAVLLRAFARALSDGGMAGWRLCIGGAGSEHHALERLANELGLAQRLDLLGELTPSEVASLLRTASLFVLPSLSEALPLSLVEAASQGVPCIASNVGGVSEVLEHEVSGWLVPAGRIDALAEALRLLSEDAQRAQRLAQRARRRLRRRFTLEAFLRDTERILTASG